ncbi:neuronal PAS domain-containing protein 2 isoform X1 [Corythoichthys intestinalis]|uniref:neuronal PAS domain-containing protein 2 isoform X1 n=1 Tax=Corythoichthys intestinalis TaxID=161448 RepID=UPI0025A65FC3|nr:neuronal PAS domain-containing protein 2 isoform X1 [Corythoichthys intestinalis]XP_057677819.1 neuronal PAS domain-containing protein 2 isoform X1 [Corythoichthys intestinalis]
MGKSVSMDNLSDFGGPCPSSRRDWDSSSCIDDLMDEDEKDRAKRASRNKSEKKRRDQFNVLIKELCTMLQGQGHPRKMDKSTILQRTIDVLQKQKDISAQNETCDVRQDWKPSFLSNEEFTQLMLEALDGFLIALTTDGNIIYVSDSVSSLIGHLPSDMVDQNILNFLPEREHGEVYKLLSSHMLMTDPIAADFLASEAHVEFCCHLARGNINPKEPPVYEYVKFVGDFKFHNNVPTTCNGVELTLPRSLQSSTEEQVCLIATVRLVTPQFLKDLCTVDDPCDEFTSRHSLEWKFLFLDHRASPIIGYLPFEVLGTSGYDYYHVDDLELIAECHKQLMQFGKGKSCYYRFLTKGQQWIWLRTHYYITYHQWNSKPEFIVCTHTVVSYAEVRAERRRAFGLEELSPPEIAPSSVKAQELYLDMCSTLDPPRERNSGTRSVSSHSSRKSSHTALSDSASANSYTETCTRSWQSASIGTERTPARLQVGSSKNSIQRQNSFDLVPQMSLPHSPPCSKNAAMQQQTQQQSPMFQLQQPQLGVMNQLKEQLEERTRILQADIKTQQQELHDIKEKLQLANLQMLLQQPIHSEFGQQPQQQGPGRPASQSQSGITRQHAVHPKAPSCRAHSSSPHSLLRENASPSAQVQPRISRSGQVQSVSLPMQTNTSLTMPFYTNPMMFSQTNTRHVHDANQRHTDNDFSQDGQLRMLLNQPMQTLVPSSSGSTQPSQQCNMGIPQTIYTLEQQIIAPSFPVQQVNCNAVLVPSQVFTSPIMIPHNSFISHQSQQSYQTQPQATQHSLQLQQPQQFFQMTQGLVHSGSTPSFLHTANISQQGTVGYIQQQPTPQTQQPQPQQRQYQHSQTQNANVSDFRNMLTR